jgi:hypothetical protein
MDQKELDLRQKIASLELEGYQKLKEAKELEACGGMPPVGDVVVGDPAPAETEAPEEGVIVLRIPKQAKEASLGILSKVAKEIAASESVEDLKLATEIDKIAEELEKSAAVLEGDADEAFMKGEFKDKAIKTEDDEPYMKEFNTDNSAELSEKVKKELPFQKVRDESK